MGTLCTKTENTFENPSEIDFHAFFKKELIGPNGNFYQLLNFLSERDVACLTYIVKALFNQSLNEKIFKFVVSFSDKIEHFDPPQHFIKLLNRKKNRHNKLNSIQNQIIPTSSLCNNPTQKDVDEIFSRSSIPIQNLKEDYYQQQIYFDDPQVLKKKQQQIQDKLQILSEALRCVQKAYETQHSQVDPPLKGCFTGRQSQAFSSFISRESRKSPLQRTMANVRINNEKTYGKKFHSGSPKNLTFTQKYLDEGAISLKKTHTLKQTPEERSIDVELKSNRSKKTKVEQQKIEKASNAQKYWEIKDFYELEVAKYKEELQYLRNRLVISEMSKQTSEVSNNLGSIVSKESKQSLLSNKKRGEAMKLCSAEVSQQVKQEIIQTMEFGTKMSSVLESDEEPDKDSESNQSYRKHAKSMIIRLFRDSKLFPVEYSKKSDPIKFASVRKKLEDLFVSYYSQQVYYKNPIERTNMILLYEERQYKKYYEYLKDYKSWIFIGKVSEELYIGAFINLKQGPKTNTKECFLFSMPMSDKPYILKAKRNIMDPMIRPEYINFGDSEFKIKSGSKTVSLSLENINMSFAGQDGSDPNTRRFSSKFGENIVLEQMEVHEVIFSRDSQ